MNEWDEFTRTAGGVRLVGGRISRLVITAQFYLRAVQHAVNTDNTHVLRSTNIILYNLLYHLFNMLYSHMLRAGLV